MNANELRVGNKVKVPEHNLMNGTVAGIGQRGIILIEEITTYSHTDLIEPIPLTPEILEAAGFVWETPKKSHLQLQIPKQGINKRNITFYYKDGVCEILQLFMEDYIDGYFEVAPPKYLHQLQNLYFALTGAELEINMMQKA